MGIATLCSAAALAIPAEATPAFTPPFALPFTDTPVRYERGKDRLRVTAVGMPRQHTRRQEAVLLSARRVAERRARAMLHEFLDQALAKVHAKPWLATRLHAVLKKHARVDGLRPLVDGSVAVAMSVRGDKLRAAARVVGTPWAR